MDSNIVKYTNPDSYEESNLAFQNILVSTVDPLNDYPALLSQMSPWSLGETVLDFGSGTGSETFKHLAPLAENTAAKIYGLDSSELMTEFALKNFAHPNVEYVVGNIFAHNCPVRQTRLNRIISRYVLQCIADYRKLFELFYGLLEPKGQFAAIADSDPANLQLHRRLKSHSTLGEYMQGLVVLDFLHDGCGGATQAYKTALIEAGFKVKCLTSNLTVFKSTDLDALIGCLMDFNPFILDVPRRLIPELRREYTEHYGPLVCQTSKTLSLEFLSFVAEK